MTIFRNVSHEGHTRLIFVHRKLSCFKLTWNWCDSFIFHCANLNITYCNYISCFRMLLLECFAKVAKEATFVSIVAVKMVVMKVECSAYLIFFSNIKLWAMYSPSTYKLLFFQKSWKIVYSWNTKITSQEIAFYCTVLHFVCFLVKDKILGEECYFLNKNSKLQVCNMKKRFAIVL